LQFTDFHYEIEIDPETARLPHRQHRVRASFVIGGTRYVQASFIDPDAGPSGKDFGRIDQQEFYQIFNKVLSDQHSDVRLHLIKTTTNFGGARAADYSRFGIIALTKKQTEVFRQAERIGNDILMYMDISYERFEDRPSPEQVRAAIAEYRASGIL